IHFNLTLASIGTNQVDYLFIDSLGCSNSASQLIQVDSVPTVVFGAITSVCADAASFTLNTGLPLGGSYTGKAITNDSIFNPAILGVGLDTIVYAYTDANGCSNMASQ